MPPMLNRMSGTPPKRRLVLIHASHRASLLCACQFAACGECAKEACKSQEQSRGRVGSVNGECPCWLRQMSCGLPEARTAGALCMFCLIHGFHASSALLCCSSSVDSIHVHKRPSRSVRLSATTAGAFPFMACAPRELCTCLSRGAKATRTRPCCKLMWLKYVFCHSTRRRPDCFAEELLAHFLVHISTISDFCRSSCKPCSRKLQSCRGSACMLPSAVAAAS